MITAALQHVLLGVLLASAMFYGASANGARLGPLSIESRYGEPLRAHIVVIADESDQGALSIRLGDATEYARLGAIWSPALLSIRVAAIHDRGDAWDVVVESDQALTELVLDLVLVLQSPQGLTARNYPLLLDLPELSPQRMASDVPTSPTADERRAPRPTATPIAQTSEPDQSAASPGAGQWVVRPGETLHDIAVQVSGDRSYLAVAREIFRLNPSAFANRDPDLLQAGAPLRLPAGAVTGAGRARVELPPSPRPEELLWRLDDWIDQEPDRLAERAPEARRDLAFAQTEIETLRNTNNLLREQIHILERRVGDLTRLVDLKGEVIRDERRALIALRESGNLALRQDLRLSESPEGSLRPTTAPAVADAADEPLPDAGEVVEPPDPAPDSSTATPGQLVATSNLQEDHAEPAPEAHTPPVSAEEVAIVERRKSRAMGMISIAILAMLAIALPPVLYRRSRPRVSYTRKSSAEQLTLPDGL